MKIKIHHLRKQLEATQPQFFGGCFWNWLTGCSFLEPSMRETGLNSHCSKCHQVRGKRAWQALPTPSKRKTVLKSSSCKTVPNKTREKTNAQFRGYHLPLGNQVLQDAIFAFTANQFLQHQGTNARKNHNLWDLMQKCAKMCANVWRELVWHLIAAQIVWYEMMWAVPVTSITCLHSRRQAWVMYVVSIIGYYVPLRSITFCPWFSGTNYVKKRTLTTYINFPLARMMEPKGHSFDNFLQAIFTGA